MADKINDYNQDKIDQYDQYYEIYDSIKIIYTLTCDDCGLCAERHQMLDQDFAAESFEAIGFIFKIGDGEKKRNKILCNACK